MGALMGKVAFVTGGSSGIGRAAAIRFAEEGAAVVVGSRRESPHEGGLPTHEVIRRGGGRAEFVVLDVTDGASVDLAISQALERMGGLHVLVCSAGVLGPVGDSREIDTAVFDRHFAVNVRGTFLCAQRALKQFVPCGYGKVVTVSSNFGHVGVAGHAAYCTSKAAVVGLTRALAVEYGTFGININCLCPGATKTAMNAHTRADPIVQERWRSMTPLRMSPMRTSRSLRISRTPRCFLLRTPPGSCTARVSSWTAAGWQCRFTVGSTATAETAPGPRRQGLHPIPAVRE